MYLNVIQMPSLYVHEYVYSFFGMEESENERKIAEVVFIT